ncbi:MAG: hypothetical protein QHH75_11885 [Bacillota bacterium]|nr:hypothetical protein [Bacillota bacterium]
MYDSKCGWVVQFLGPVYAIPIAIVVLRELLDRLVMKVFPEPKKEGKKTNRPRKSVIYERKQYPGLRYYRTKKGLRVSWYE